MRHAVDYSRRHEEAQEMTTQLYLTPSDHGRALSLEEFLTADAEPGHRYEIIEGRLEVSPVPNLPHDELLDWLRDELRAYSLAHRDVVARVKGPARVFLPEHRAGPTAPEPDLACYPAFPDDRPIRERRWQDISPVLVVEVLSADTADKDLRRNRRLYLRVPSIREYWILDPREDADRPSLLVYRRGGSRWERVQKVAPGETYKTPLLPGFTLVVDPHHEG
jgi:Uma2 family endonuclease